jgi:hypothetical protein
MSSMAALSAQPQCTDSPVRRRVGARAAAVSPVDRAVNASPRAALPERAHVLAQRMTGRHTFIHWRMLVAGLGRGDVREIAGQLPRIVASILFSRLWVPRGNSGRSRVSAFKPMPVPADLRHLVP